MAWRGSVNDSSFTSPRTPNAPWTFPSWIICWSGWRVGVFIVLAGRAQGAAFGSGSSHCGHGRLACILVQRADLVAHLRAVLDPVVNAGGVEHDTLFATGGDRVVITHALDVATVARTARVGDDDVVEGALLGAAAGKADLDHGVVLVLPSRQDGEVSRRLYRVLFRGESRSRRRVGTAGAHRWSPESASLDIAATDSPSGRWALHAHPTPSLAVLGGQARPAH